MSVSISTIIDNLIRRINQVKVYQERLKLIATIIHFEIREGWLFFEQLLNGNSYRNAVFTINSKKPLECSSRSIVLFINNNKKLELMATINSLMINLSTDVREYI